jgi:hypothetical protein
MKNRWLTRIVGGASSLILSATMVMALAHFGILNRSEGRVLAAPDWVKCCADAKCGNQHMYCCAASTPSGCRCVAQGTACER